MINTDGHHKRPASLNLSNTQKGINPGSLPSALVVARIIKDLVSGEYHELETRAQYWCEGWQVLVYKFDPRKISLLLFIVVTIAISCCNSYLSAKTSQTTFSFGFLGLEPADQSQHAMYRGGSGRRAPNAVDPRALNRQPSGFVGLGINHFGGKGNFNAMGSFGAGLAAKSSEERFRQAQAGPNTPTSATSQFKPGLGAMSCVGSNSGQTLGIRNETKRRNEKPSQSGFVAPSQMLIGADGLPLGHAKPLEKATNAWAPGAQQRTKAKKEENSPASSISTLFALAGHYHF
jgi:hypothetical protein